MCQTFRFRDKAQAVNLWRGRNQWVWGKGFQRLPLKLLNVHYRESSSTTPNPTGFQKLIALAECNLSQCCHCILSSRGVLQNIETVPNSPRNCFQSTGFTPNTLIVIRAHWGSICSHRDNNKVRPIKAVGSRSKIMSEIFRQLQTSVQKKINCQDHYNHYNYIVKAIILPASSL